MGFKDELEKIFAAMGKTVDRQLLLFSATLPPWVKKIAARHARTFVVGGDRSCWWGKDGLNKIVQASTDVKHTCVPVSSWSQNHKVINDVVGAYGTGSTIVFCESGRPSATVIEARTSPLIGRQPCTATWASAAREDDEGLPREEIFGVGCYRCGARGLDCIVDLVVMNKPPATRSGWADTETYVHRSGRTGTSGKEGHLCDVVSAEA